MKIRTYAKALAGSCLFTLATYFFSQSRVPRYLLQPIGPGPQADLVGTDTDAALVTHPGEKNAFLLGRVLEKNSRLGYGEEALGRRLNVSSLNALRSVGGGISLFNVNRRNMSERQTTYSGLVAPVTTGISENNVSNQRKRVPMLFTKLKNNSHQSKGPRNSASSSVLAVPGSSIGPQRDIVRSRHGGKGRKCPGGPTLSINSGGRLGNKLCRYLTVWILARRIPNASVQIMPAMETKLNLYFSGHRQLAALSRNCSSAISWHHVRLGENGTFAARLARGESLLIDGGPCPLSWFYSSRSSILSELRWSDDISAAVDRRLALVPRGSKTLVGVHVRRGDYSEWLRSRLNGHLVSPAYIQCALKLARRRYQRPAFLVSSDDMAWCRRNIAQSDDVIFVGSNASEAVDMATLARCHHSVVTYGTFGYMSAFLAGGDVVVPTGFSEKEYLLWMQLERAPVRVTRLPDAVDC